MILPTAGGNELPGATSRERGDGSQAYALQCIQSRGSRRRGKRRDGAKCVFRAVVAPCIADDHSFLSYISLPHISLRSVLSLSTVFSSFLFVFFVFFRDFSARIHRSSSSSSLFFVVWCVFLSRFVFFLLFFFFFSNARLIYFPAPAILRETSRETSY